jgi:hypothetical protein
MRVQARFLETPFTSSRHDQVVERLGFYFARK